MPQSTFWFKNWSSVKHSSNVDQSVTWQGFNGSITNCLKFNDNTYVLLNDTDIPAFGAVPYSGSGVIAYLAGSAISDQSLIPSNALIEGLTLNILRSATLTPDALNRFPPSISSDLNVGLDVIDSEIQLHLNGQFIGNNKSNSQLWLNGNFRLDTFGGPTDKWGMSSDILNPATINSSGFGVSLLPFFNWNKLDYPDIPELYVIKEGSGYPYLYNLKGGLHLNARVEYVNLTISYTTPFSQDINVNPIQTDESYGNNELPRTGEFFISDFLLARNIAKKEIANQSKITGIIVGINKMGSDSTVNHTLETYDEVVRLYLNGILIGDNKAKSTLIWPDINSGYQKIIYGNSSDLWGLDSLTGLDINDQDFGVAINTRFRYDNENDINNIKVDYIDIELQYEPSRSAQDILPDPITSDENFNNPNLLRQNAKFLNQIFSPAYEVGYFDIMALSRDINIDPHYDLSYSSLNTNYLFTANNINLNYKQESNFGKRLAGEGANPNTFKVDTRTYDLTFNIPIRIESWGYIDTVFSALYDFFIQGYKGSSTVYLGRIKSDNNNSLINVSTLKVDNIVDFMNLSTPFAAYIKSDNDIEESENIIITSVNKITKILTLQNPTSKPHTPNISYVWAKPNNPSSNREPSFNIFSLREGLFSGCVVNSIEINIAPGQTINASINLKFTNLDRKYQSNIFKDFDLIASNINDRRPNFLINGAQISIENGNNTSSQFTLGDVKNSPLFMGYQENLIRDFEVNSFNIKFDNNLQTVYSLNAKSSSEDKNFIKNLQPYAYYSNGRSISGSIKYSSPLKPWLFAEKLSGPESLNKQDLIINFGPFKLLLPEVIWSPDNSESRMEEVHQKSVSFSVATQKLAYDPYFEPTGIL